MQTSSFSPVDKIHLLDQIEQYSAKDIWLKRPYYDVYELTDTVALFANKARFFQILGVFPGIFSPKRSRCLPIFYIFDTTNSSWSSYNGKSLRKKKSMFDKFRAKVLGFYKEGNGCLSFYSGQNKVAGGGRINGMSVRLGFTVDEFRSQARNGLWMDSTLRR